MRGGDMLGKTEDLLIVLLIVLVLFGAKRLPELAKSVGQSVREVRKGFSEDADISTKSDNTKTESEA